MNPTLPNIIIGCATFICVLISICILILALFINETQEDNLTMTKQEALEIIIGAAGERAEMYREAGEELEPLEKEILEALDVLEGARL